MNTLDLLEMARPETDARCSVQWAQCSRERLLGEALTSDVESIQAWSRRARLAAHPCLLTAATGLLLQLELASGLVSVWVESHGSPFWEALRSKTDELDPSWISACLLACWPEMVEILEVRQVRSVCEFARPEDICSGWSVGSLRLAFVECDERLFDQLRSSSKPRREAFDLQVIGLLKMPLALWSRLELDSLSVGDAVVLARASGHAFRAAWVLGASTDIALVVNVNWRECTMSWTGEMDALDETHVQDGQRPEEHSVDLSALKVPVSFELEAGSYSLSVLQAMRPGQLMDLRSQPSHCVVQMVSGGRRLASGRLVQIGDSLAVRIDQIWLKSEGEQHD